MHSHSAKQKYVSVWESRWCWTCWQARFVALSIICTIPGTILLAVALFDDHPIHGNVKSIGEAGITLMGMGIIFAALASHRE